VSVPLEVTVPGSLRVANAPVSFGVDEILVQKAWMPEPDQVLDLIADLGYEGTELGPPGYLGDGARVRERLASRGLELVGSFLPLRLTRPELCWEEDEGFLEQTLDLLREAAAGRWRPLVVLSDGFDSPLRLRFAGQISRHPEARLPVDRWQIVADTLHRAAERCLSAGFGAVFHPHAGTYVETPDEIDFLMERVDPSLVGLCLDTGHVRFGGGDPLALIERYGPLIRHVHLKDCRASVLEEAARSGGGMDAALVAGAFVELGQGDSQVAEVVAALQRIGYQGWLVVEQDRYLFPGDTLDDLRRAQGRNREFLRRLGI
jgi:inosose dehydratase